MGQNTSSEPQNPGLKLSHAQEALDLLTQIEGQFGQVKQGLAHLQRLSTLGTLTASVAHEFNNILTPIISYAQLALAKPGDPELSHKAHTKAVQGAQRASDLCANLLGYAREDHAGDVADLSNVVHSSIDCLGKSLKSQGIELVLDLPHAQLAIRPSDLEQVLVNLILNARKAMTPAGGTLTIRATLEREVAQVVVADTGRGVPAEVADQLFEPFITFNPDKAHDAQPGTGLGLSVSRDIITAAHGSITFDSTPGEGATFCLTLPLAGSLRQSA